MKKTAALILICSMLFSMLVPAYAEDELVPISVGKKVTSLYYGEGGHNNNIVANANDQDNATLFESRKGAGNSDAVTIDLGKECVLGYVTVVFASYSGSYEIQVSQSEDFSSYTVLEEQESRFFLPEAEAENAFRYVRLAIADSESRCRVRELTVFGNAEDLGGSGDTGDEDEPDDDIPEEPGFEEQLLNVALGKSIVSKLYGSGGYISKVADANDGDPETSWISATTKEDWLRVDLGEQTRIHSAEFNLQYYGDARVIVSNDSAAGQTVQMSDYVVLEKRDDGKYYLPEEHKRDTFRMIQLEKLETPGVDAMYCKEFNVYTSTRDIVTNQAQGKPEIKDGKISDSAFTDSDINKEVTAKKVVIDLLTPSYVNYVKLIGADKDKLIIKGSLFADASENAEIIPGETADNKKYRYITVEGGEGEEFSLAEIEVYTFDSDSVAPWKREKNTFKTTITNNSYDEERSYSVYVSAFDSYNMLITAWEKSITLTPGKSEAIDIELPAAGAAENVVCMVDDGNGGTNTAVYNFSGDDKNIITGDAAFYESSIVKNITEAVTSEVYNDGIKLTATQNGGLCDSDIIRVTVRNSEGKLMYADAKAAGENTEFLYYLPGDSEAGEYKAYLTVTDVFGKSASTFYTFTKNEASEDALTNAINDFKALDKDGFEEAYNKHFITDGTISLRDIPEAEEMIKEIGESFVIARDTISKWTNKSAAELDEKGIRNSLKAALVIDALENQREDAFVVITKYMTVMDSVFDESVDVKKVIGLYKVQEKATPEKIVDNIKITTALSAMKDETIENMAKTMEKYAEILKVDLKLIGKRGVDILEVAKKLSNSIPDDYYDGLDEEIEAILDKIAPVKTKPSGGSGGGGGGSYSSSSGINNGIFVVPEVKVPEEAEKEKVSFEDVRESHWAYESILALAEKGIISGDETGKFDAERAVSRAEFAKMIVSAFSMTAKADKKIEFTDCKVSDWFYPFIDAAVSNSIVNGVSKTEFSPQSTIKRQDAAVICSNVLVWLSNFTPYDYLEFTDFNTVSEYARDAVLQLAGLGIINGFEDGSFNPSGELTRAQAAVIINKLLQVTGK